MGRRSVRSRKSSALRPRRLHKWVRQAETDQGVRSGLTSDERSELRECAGRYGSCGGANEILKKASPYFTQAESTPYAQMTPFIDEHR